MLEYQVPGDKTKIKRQIEALKWQVEHDTDEMSKQIHGDALKKALAALEDQK